MSLRIVVVSPARPLYEGEAKFLSQPFFVAEAFTGLPGRYVKLEDSIRSFKDIVDGKCDYIPEQAFYMAGTIDEVYERAEKMGVTAAA